MVKTYWVNKDLMMPNTFGCSMKRTCVEVIKKEEVKKEIENFFDPETLEQIFPEYGADGESIDVDLIRDELKKQLGIE